MNRFLSPSSRTQNGSSHSDTSILDSAKKFLYCPPCSHRAVQHGDRFIRVLIGSGFTAVASICRKLPGSFQFIGFLMFTLNLVHRMQSVWNWSKITSRFNSAEDPQVSVWPVKVWFGPVQFDSVSLCRACDDVSSKTQQQRTRTSRFWWTQSSLLPKGKQFKRTSLSVLWDFFNQMQLSVFRGRMWTNGQELYWKGKTWSGAALRSFCSTLSISVTADAMVALVLMFGVWKVQALLKQWGNHWPVQGSCLLWITSL